ncbi:MAG: putative transporter [Methanobacterium sp. PtaB.Bin024]|nr:MAG: putative transporter [Methanobacterium sp. PtaB.Bin024]
MATKTVETTTSLQKVSLILVVISSFLIPFMGSSLSIALPLIQKDLAINILMLGWIPNAFVLANAALVLPFGRLADIHGRRKVFAGGIIIYTLASLLAGFSNSGMMILLFSSLQGLGSAMIFATAIALLISIYPHKMRGRVLGIYVTAVYLGMVFGPLLGGFLAQNFGWRGIYFANVPLGLFALIILFAWFKGEWKSSDGEKFDLLGSIIYASSLSLLMYGVSTLHGSLGKLMLVMGIIGLVIFYMVEKRCPNPVIPLDIFKNRRTSLSGIALLLITVATSAMWTLLSLYLQDLRSLDPLTTALILSVQPLFVALLSPLVGRITDKSDNKMINITGTIICTIGLLTLATVGEKTTLIFILTGLSLVGLGMGLFATPTNRNFLESLIDKFYGVGSATLSTMVYVGQTVSLGILLFILTGFMGDVQIVPSTYSLFMEGLHVTFIVFAVISAIGAFVTFMSRKYRLTEDIK